MGRRMRTPNMYSTIASANTVFLTPELLEQILAHLPIDHLLVAQRVSPQWASLIAASPRLQRLLFLRADDSLPARLSNPLFAAYFQDIACHPDLSGFAAASPPPRRAPPQAHLKLTHGKMRELLRHRDNPHLRGMLMFQPPCAYALTLSSAGVFDITVKFVSEPHVPVLRAVERAAHIAELESDKKRNLWRNLDRRLVVGRGQGIRHVVGGRPGAVGA